MGKWKKESEGIAVDGHGQYSINPDPMTDPHKEASNITVFGDKLADKIVALLNEADVDLED